MHPYLHVYLVLKTFDQLSMCYGDLKIVSLVCRASHCLQVTNATLPATSKEEGAPGERCAPIGGYNNIVAVKLGGVALGDRMEPSAVATNTQPSQQATYAIPDGTKKASGCGLLLPWLPIGHGVREVLTVAFYYITANRHVLYTPRVSSSRLILFCCIKLYVPNMVIGEKDQPSCDDCIGR